MGHRPRSIWSIHSKVGNVGVAPASRTMKVLAGSAFSVVLAVDLLFLTCQQAEGWNSYLQTLSNQPHASTAPPAYPAPDLAGEMPRPESQANAGAPASLHEDEYLKFLSSPPPLLQTLPGGFYSSVGALEQPPRTIQPPAVVPEERMLKSTTTGTDYLSRLSGVSSSTQKPVHAEQVTYSSSSYSLVGGGSIDYLSQLSTRTRSDPREARTAAAETRGEHQAEPPASPCSAHATLSSEYHNGANYMAFLSGPSMPQTSETGDYSGFNTKPKRVEGSYSPYLSAISSTASSTGHSLLSVKPVLVDSADPAPSGTSVAIDGPTTEDKLETKPKHSYAPFGIKPSTSSSASSALGLSYMNFLGTGPARTRWYAEPLTVGSSSKARRKSRASKDSELDRGALQQVGATGSTAAQAKPVTYSPFGTKPKSALETGFLSELDAKSSSGNGAAISERSLIGSKTSTAAASSSVSASDSTFTLTSYLSSLDQAGSSRAPTDKLSPLTFSLFGRKPLTAPENEYLAGLGGVSERPSPGIPAKASGVSGSDVSKSASGSTGYSPFGSTPKEVAQTGYLGQLGTTKIPIYTSMAEAPLVDEAISSSTSSSYSPVGSKPKVVAEKGYLGGLSGEYPTSYLPAAEPAVPPKALSSNLLSFSPFGSKPKVVTESGYLGKLRSEAAVPSSVESPCMTTSETTSLPSLSHSPFGSKPKAVVETGYLGSLTARTAKASPSDSTPLTTEKAVAVASAPTNLSPFGLKPKAVAKTCYRGSLRNGASDFQSDEMLSQAETVSPPKVPSTPRKSYSPFGSKPKAVAETGYLGSLSDGASVSPSGNPLSSSVKETQAAVPSPPRTSYSPFGSTPKAVAESGYLVALKIGTTAGTSRPPAGSSERWTSIKSNQPASYLPFGSKPKAVAETGYLGSLGADRNVARLRAATASPVSEAMPSASITRPATYLPFGSKPKAVVESGYLGGLGVGSATAPLAAPGPISTSADSLRPVTLTYASFGSKPKPVRELGYLGGLIGGNVMMVSSADSTPSQTNAKASSSYSPFGVKPKSVHQTGYLGGLAAGGSNLSLSGAVAPTASHARQPLESTEIVPAKHPPESTKQVLKPSASYHPVSGTLVEVRSTHL